MKTALSDPAGNASAIQALIARVNELTASLDRWNKVMLVGLAVAAFAALFIVVSTRLTVVRSKQLSLAQSELDSAKELQLAFDLKEKDQQIAQAQERAGNAAKGAADAQGNVAILQKAATDAKTVQQRVSIQLAKQQERAAEAERTLLQLQEGQRGRRVIDHSLSVALKGKPTGTVTIWYQPNDPEAYWFAFDIMAELDLSGWKVSLPVPIPENISSTAFLPPEFQGRNRLDSTQPPAVRIGGGTGELFVLSNSPDKHDPKSPLTALMKGIIPLTRHNWGWRLASTLPDNAFLLIVGPKP